MSYLNKFMHGGGLPIDSIPCPTVYQIEEAILKYNQYPKKELVIDNLPLSIYDMSAPFFVAKGRRIGAFIDPNGRINLSDELFRKIHLTKRWDEFKTYFNILLRGFQGERIELFEGEFRDILSALVKLNEASPGNGLTSKMAENILKIYPDPSHLDQKLINWDLDKAIPKILGNTYQILAKIRMRKQDKNKLSSLEEYLFEMDKQYERPRPIRIFFLSFGSQWHQDVWNILSIETLVGDLLGEFGNEIKFEIKRIYEISELESVINVIHNFGPDLIGISLEIGTQGLFDEFVSIFQGIQFRRKKPLIVCGNVLATYSPEYFINNSLFREGNLIIIRGEGELALRHLVRVMKGETLLKNTSNLIYFDLVENKIIEKDIGPSETKHLIHPPYPLTLVENKVNILQSSRGCVFSCSYCTQGPNKVWKALPLDRVLENMEVLMSLGINEFEFVDDEFFGGRTNTYLERVKTIANSIIQLKKKYDTTVSFRIFSNPLILAHMNNQCDSKNDQIINTLRLMKTSGLSRIYLGFESGAIKQRIRYNRKESLEECVRSLEILRELDINTDIGFIMFDPEMALDEISENIKFFRKYNLIQSNTWPFRPMVVTKGTPIYDRLKTKGLLGDSEQGNILSCKYKFEDHRVAIIFEHIQTFAKKSDTLFYILKYFTKEHHDREKHDQALLLARGLVIENALIYLDLLEDMVNSIKESHDLGLCINKARLKLQLLIKEVETKISLFEQNKYQVKYLKESIEQAKENLFMET